MRFGSLFSGIGGFDLGFERSGMKCAWQCEIDKACQQVLQKQFGVKIYDDVRTITREQAEPVDLICGGFPCQDLSIAGKRKGLAGNRSGLWFEFARVIDEFEPSWVVIENVPGLLSSDKGRDFAIILRWLAVRGYGVAWRVLDAQYFGVAQRRKRVFIVASFGNGRAAEVLFEREGVCWNPPARRKEGEGITKEVAGSVTGHYHKGVSADDLNMVAFENHPNDSRIKETGDISQQLTSRMGTGGGNVPLVLNDQGGSQMSVSEDLTATLRTQEHGHQPLIAYDIHQNDDHRKDRPEGGLYVNETDKSLTVQTGEGKSKTVISTFRMESFGEYSDDGSASAIKQRDFKDATDLVATTWTERAGKPGGGKGYLEFQDGAMCLSGQPQFVGVRRLTPTECARLQGFPDDWNSFLSDSARYKQFGNAVCVNVAEWIGKRIMEVNK